MKGKITMSRSGSTGRTSGIFGVSSSFSFLISSVILLLPLDGDHGLPAPALLEAGQGDDQEARFEASLRLAQVHGAFQGYRPLEAPARPLEAHVVLPGPRPPRAALAADHDLALAADDLHGFRCEP